MKKIFLILIMVISTYGFTSDIEATAGKGGPAQIVSICVFPSDTAEKGFLFVYVQGNGFQQVMANDSPNGATKFASCQRKTK